MPGTLSRGLILCVLAHCSAARLEGGRRGEGADDGQCGLSSRLARQRTPPGVDRKGGLSFFFLEDGYPTEGGNGPKDGTEATSIPLSLSLSHHTAHHRSGKVAAAPRCRARRWQAKRTTIRGDRQNQTSSLFPFLFQILRVPICTCTESTRLRRVYLNSRVCKGLSIIPT